MRIADFTAAIAASSVLLAGCQLQPTAAPAPAPVISMEACAPLGAEHPLQCGQLAVPERRDAPGARTILLNVWVIPALGDKRLPPLYDLPGGPGNSATGGAGFYLEQGSAYRQHRDIVLMDQRGSGQSAPLKCPELSFSDPLVPVLDAGAAARCRARLSTSADLAAYSTAESVTDLEALRAALGHRQIDLIALSYGTRVAQEYLRRYPARVRAVALLGAVAPDALVPLSYTESAQAVLEALARDCAADAQCRKAVPDLRADIGHVARQLAAGEVLAAAPGGNSIPAEPGPFWQALRAKLISTDSQRQLPWLLHQAAAGRFGPILAALQPAGGGDSSDGMLLSITCPEDTLHITPEQLAAVPTSVFGTYRQEQQLAACRAWGVPRTEPVRDWVQGPTPVLLVAGAMDHVTPPTMAHAIASRLTHARVIEIPYLGHMPGGLDHMECYDQVINQFFDQGSAAELALDCLSAMQPPAFVLGG